MPEPLGLEARLHLLSLEDRQRLALAKNAHIRSKQHLGAAKREKRLLQTTIVELRRSGVPTA